MKNGVICFANNSARVAKLLSIKVVIYHALFLALPFKKLWNKNMAVGFGIQAKVPYHRAATIVGLLYPLTIVMPKIEARYT